MITSVLAFISTNIDDIFILMLFYGSGKFRHSGIVAGQYLGIATLVAISFVGSYIGSFVDQRYVGLLGLFPVYLAIKHFIRKEETEEAKAYGILSIAGVTIANGGDNIGVYIPLLSTMTVAARIQLIVIFAIMTFLWCMLAGYLAKHPLIARQLDKYGHIIMPVVLFCLGIFILIESNTFSLL